MKIKIHFIITLLFLKGFVPGLNAQQGDSVYSQRHFDQEQINTLKSDDRFSYYNQETPNSFWKNLGEWLVDKLKKIFTHVPEEKLSSVLAFIFKAFLWGLALFAISMLFYSLFKHGGFSKVLNTKNVVIPVDFENLEDNVIETDWLSLIEQEKNSKRFNVAIRLLYLYTIQQLHKKGFIAWKKDKTNREYINELEKYPISEDFRQLTYYYDYAWFGNFHVHETLFEQIDRQFKTFNKSTQQQDVEKV